MIVSFELMRHATLQGTDGAVGHVKDLFFDGQSWHVRYLVVETGSWLSGRRVLLAPEALNQREWDQHQVRVQLSQQQVRQAPDVDTHRPVSRQQELELMQHYDWQPYWTIGLDAAPPLLLPPVAVVPDTTDEPPKPQEDEDADLRSAREVIGYHLHARDGTLGSISDLLVDDQQWQVRQCIITTGHWFSSQSVALDVGLIRQISWDRREADVDITCDQARQWKH